MHARVATFESEPGVLDQMVEGMKKDIESGDIPEGLEGAKEVMVFVDRESGRTVGVTLFDDEEGMRRGHEALNKMSPDGPMRRTSVDLFEVPIRKSL
jgi:hypothetical protein